MSAALFRNLLLTTSIPLILSACAMPAWLPFGNSDNGQSLAPGDQVTLHFFTRDPAFDSGVNLQSGASYQLDVKQLSHWIDSDIERNEHERKLDEKGFDNSVMPAQWLGWLRRSRTHNWFELMLMQPNCKSASLAGVSDLTIDEASGSYNFVATCDGNLTLFVNDSHGFYSNNAGYANFTLSRVN